MSKWCQLYNKVRINPLIQQALTYLDHIEKFYKENPNEGKEGLGYGQILKVISNVRDGLNDKAHIYP